MYRIFRSGDAGGTTAVGGSPPVAGVTNSGATGTLEVEFWAIDDGVTTSGGRRALGDARREVVRGKRGERRVGLVEQDSRRRTRTGSSSTPPLAVAVVVEPAAVLDAPEPPSPTSTTRRRGTTPRATAHDDPSTPHSVTYQRRACSAHARRVQAASIPSA